MASSVQDASAKIDQYIASLPPWSRAICEELRALVNKAAPSLSEELKWAVPAFCGNGIVCGFAAFKKHVVLDFWHGAQIDDAHKLFNHCTGKVRGRSIKFVAGAAIPKPRLAGYIKQAVKLDAAGAGEKKVRPVVKVIVPDRLRAGFGLKKRAKAKQFFDSLPRSAKRDYCEWISGAKREDTRERRLKATLEQLGRGERLHDKYRC